jgi:hypothetical protein
MAASVTLEQGPKKLAVKATPGRTLAEILTEFCEKFGLKSEEWTLSFKQKNVDLALPFRLSGIPQNAKLEVIKRAKSGPGAFIGVLNRVIYHFYTISQLFFELSRAFQFIS